MSGFDFPIRRVDAGRNQAGKRSGEQPLKSMILDHDG